MNTDRFERERDGTTGETISSTASSVARHLMSARMKPVMRDHDRPSPSTSAAKAQAVSGAAGAGAGVFGLRAAALRTVFLGLALFEEAFLVAAFFAGDLRAVVLTAFFAAVLTVLFLAAVFFFVAAFFVAPFLVTALRATFFATVLFAAVFFAGLRLVVAFTMM